MISVHAIGPLLSILTSVSPTQDVTSPAEHLGRAVGTDFQLADWTEASSYYGKLAAESPNVLLETIGTSTEGRPFLLATISSPDNLARLPEIRAHARTLADPRGKSDEEKRAAIRDGRVILFVSCSMHSTETAGTEFGMAFAHKLATSDEEPWKSARSELVVNVIPTVNPDGLDHVVSWYREHVGTPFEAAGLLKLYQYYTGHDNNRDWFMLSQRETQIVTRQLYKVWFPQVYWDVHQQGSTRERLFVPPFRDPLNPNLDPGIISAIDALGSRALLDLTRAGFQGVSTGVSYDMWWNGGNRNVPVRHNIVGLLTEAASVRIATPMFLRRSDLSAPRGLGDYAPSNRFPDPWPGGWWRLANIIEYEMAFGESLVGSLARERETWLTNALEASQRVIERGKDDGARGWLIPSDTRDPAAARRLMHILIQSGIEVSVADEPLELDGRTWPAGSVVVRRDQPYGSHLKDLFEVQRYPDGDPPYDVAGWTLPLLLGVRRVELMQEVPAGLRGVDDANAAVAAFSGDARKSAVPRGWLASSDSDDWTKLFGALTQGEAHTFVGAGERAGLFVPGEAATNEDEAGVALESMPRVGLYAPWRGNMDEGWMRWVLDTWQLPYVRVRNEMLRAGSLADFLDVLIVPSMSSGALEEGRSPGDVPAEFTRGLAPEGSVAIEEFVRGGGKLICVGSSAGWAVDLMRLPLVDVTRGEEAGEFSCPGSVVRALPEEGALTAGLPESVAVFFSRSSAWREMTEAEREDEGLPEAKLSTWLSYAPTHVLLSGWIRAPETIAGHAAWVAAEHGAGRVHLFGFRPQYRGWSQASFHLLFRAIMID
ncbi:MAG: peptidase M14 [bacterium]|nr:peptidase M14 [bacterium]